MRTLGTTGLIVQGAETLTNEGVLQRFPQTDFHPNAADPMAEAMGKSETFNLPTPCSPH